MQKHKFASISLTMRDRAISSKFSTHWVSQQSTLTHSFSLVVGFGSLKPLTLSYQFIIGSCMKKRGHKALLKGKPKYKMKIQYSLLCFVNKLFMDLIEQVNENETTKFLQIITKRFYLCNYQTDFLHVSETIGFCLQIV